MKFVKEFRKRNETADAVSEHDVLHQVLVHAPEHPPHTFTDGIQDDLFQSAGYALPLGVVNLHFKHFFPFHGRQTELTLRVTSGSVRTETGQVVSRKKIILRLESPDLELSYHLFPQGQDNFARLDLKNIPVTEKNALVQVLKRFIVDNPNFTVLPPAADTNPRHLARRQEQFGTLHFVEAKNVQHWLKDALGRH